MPQISTRSLILVIQAVDREINRLKNLPDETITASEELLLVDYESLADELEELYAAAAPRGQTNLPDYSLLVTDRESDSD